MWRRACDRKAKPLFMWSKNLTERRLKHDETPGVGEEKKIRGVAA